MAGGVGRDVEHVEVKVHGGDVHPVALDQTMVNAVDVLVGRSEHGYGRVREQAAQAADVIGMMMGDEDGCELQLLTLKVVDDGLGVARIDHQGMAAVVHEPDVVIAKGGKRDNGHP